MKSNTPHSKKTRQEPDTGKTGTPKRKREWLLVILILLGTFVVFSPALKGDFVEWDDDENITNNSSILEINRENLKTIFSTPITGGYTPLPSVTFALESQLFGLRPGVFHFNNLILHLLVTLLVYIFLRKLGISKMVSYLVMILFAIHPMRVESVAWITERKDVLFSLFFFLSLLSYIAWHKTRRRLFYFLALLAFIPALLSKIQAVSLPLVLILIDYWLDGKFRIRQLPNKLPFFLLSLMTGVAGLYILYKGGTMDTGTVMSFAERIFIGTYTFFVYLIKSVVPWQLSAIYPYPGQLSVLHYASAPALLLLLYLLYRFGRRNKVIVFGSLFFLFNVMFVLQVVGAGQAYLADRFTYIPYLGLFFLYGHGLGSVIEGKKGLSHWKTPVSIGLSIYIAVLSVVTWNRTKAWENTETLFTDVVKKYPGSAMAHNNLGVHYRNGKQYQKAITAYTNALNINPSSPVIHNNRGELYFDLGDIDKAMEDMNAAIRIKPDYVKALTNRGAAWGYKKEYARAIEDLDKAVSLDPENISAYSNRILVHFSLGNFDQAIQDADSYLAIKPDEGDIYNIRGLCYMRLKRNQEAMADFNRSIELNGQTGSYYQNRSTLHFNMRNYPAALNDIRKAQEFGTTPKPGYIELLQKRIAESIR